MTFVCMVLLVLAVVAALPACLLAANREVPRFTDERTRVYPLAAGAKIYKGATVGLHPVSRLAKPYEPPDIFAGIAYEAMDNSGGAASAKSARVYVMGDFVLTLAGAAQADVGKPAFAVDDESLTLVGHPDGYVGRIIGLHAANQVTIRLRDPLAKVPRLDGAIEYLYDGDGVFLTGATAGEGPAGPMQVRSTLGLGATLDPAVGGVSLAFDATAEVAHASIETPVEFSITKGISVEWDLNAEAVGDNAALDMDWGIVNVLDANTRANLDHASATRLATFHMDGAAADILVQSDDDTTDVAPVDSTIDNVTTAGATKRFNLIVRSSGLVEFWINATRVLSGTAFSVGSAAGLFGAFINLEKSSDDTVAEIVCKRMRAAGARAA